jgi:hypothetical protein
MHYLLWIDLLGFQLKPSYTICNLMFIDWISQEAMETMQAEPITDGKQPMTSTYVVCKVLCVY